MVRFIDSLTKWYNHTASRIVYHAKENGVRHLNIIYPFIRELNVILGAGGMTMPGWFPTEYDFLDITKEADWAKLFATKSINRILAEHVWEHLSLEEGIEAAKNCFKYLKPGGRARIAVPDGLHPSQQYIESVKCGGTGPGADDHKVLYTYKSIQEGFKFTGFKITLLEYWDEQQNFNYTPWNKRDGLIHRSSMFDERNLIEELSYTSIILDAIKT